MNKIFSLFILLFMMTALNESAVKAQVASNFEWSKLSSIPNKIGFAGSFAGVADGVLVVAGGANFPDGGAPWTGSAKAWTDQVFVLPHPKGDWQTVGKLPKKLGYGVSVNYKNNLIIIGGSNENGHQSDVFILNYLNGKIKIANLPSLPKPIANSCGVVVEDVIYVMGGIATPDAKTAETNFWSLDLASTKKEWKILKSWPGVGRMLSVAGAQNGAVYLFSGVELIDVQRKYLTDAYSYMPNKGWTRLTDLPSAVAAAPTPAFAANKKELFVFGGDDGLQAQNASVLRDKHPGFSNQILSYSCETDEWATVGKIWTEKNNNSITNPNESTWAPVTTTLTVWQGAVILPGGEVRPATRTPNVLMAKPINK